MDYGKNLIKFYELLEIKTGKLAFIWQKNFQVIVSYLQSKEVIEVEIVKVIYFLGNCEYMKGLSSEEI